MASPVTVRHPITMFVVAVLAVIGIGVGVVAATTNQKVYGPSWGRFTAAFPSRVFEHRDDGFVTFAADVSGWTGYAPLSGVGPTYWGVSVASGVPMRLAVGKAKKGYSEATEHQQHVNDFSVTTFGPEREYGFWEATAAVTNGSVVWELLAVSVGSASDVENFIASFQPIG